MTIAELFVKLGFISDTADLDKTKKSLELAEGAAKKLALGVAVVDTAMTLLMKRTIGIVVGLQKFRTETGLSTDQLQRWQYAARMANVSASDVTSAIKTIQDAQAGIKLGEGNIAPWQLLGIDPRQDPIAVLDEIADRIKNLDPGVARHITAQMGISDDMFYLLKQVADGKMSLQDFNKIALVTPEQEAEVMKLNKDWQQLVYSMERGAIKISTLLEPAFQRLIPIVTDLIDRGSKFAVWAAGSSEEAQKFRNALTYLAEGALILGPVLTGLVGIFTVLKSILLAADIVKGIAAIAGAFGILGLTVAGVAFDIAEIIRLYKIVSEIGKDNAIANDAGAAAESGEQRLGRLMREKGYKPRTERERQIMEGTYEKDGEENSYSAMNHPTAIAHITASITSPKPATTIVVPPGPTATPGQPEAKAVAAQAAPPQANVTTNVTIHVNGNQSPKETAAAVMKAIDDSKRKEYASVSDQMALPAQGY